MNAQRSVSLPMYLSNRAALLALWQGLRAHLVRAGIAGVPQALDWPNDHPAHWQDPQLLLSQSCGYPLTHALAGTVQLLGASPWRIVWRHIMPLCVSSVIVRVTLDMAGIILTAAGLGFLGLGAQPPMPEWGALIANGRMYVLDQWWVAAAPGAAIFIVSLAFNLLGDGLRDALDPKDGQ